MNYIKIISAFAILFFLGCREDNFESITTISGPAPSLKVHTGYYGIVTNESGNTLEGVTITFGDILSLSDKNGVFIIEGIAPSDRAYLKASLDGYYTAFADLSPIRDSKGSVGLMLIEKKLKAIINSNSGGVVLLENGSEISFQPNAFQNEQGSDYVGDVSVYAEYIDPTADNFHRILPGNLSGINKDSENVGLISYGMINVELHGENGEILQITKDAELKIRIPESKLLSADESIPLWFFDEELGLWIEEFYAIKQGEFYQGKVSHFSLWNCDFGVPVVNLEGTILANTEPVSGIKLRITWIDMNDSRYIVTSADGEYLGLVPANQILLFEILGSCNEIVFSEEIGPFSSSAVHDAAIDEFNLDITEVSGTLVCEDNPIENGYVLSEIENRHSQIFVVERPDGMFEESILTCDAVELHLTGIDINNSEFGNVNTYEISQSEVEAGNLEACGDQLEYGAWFEFNNWSPVYMPDIGISSYEGDGDGVFYINVFDSGDGWFFNYQISIYNIDWEDLSTWSFTVVYSLNGPVERAYPFDDNEEGIGEFTFVKDFGDFIELRIEDVQFTDKNNNVDYGVLVLRIAI